MEKATKMSGHPAPLPKLVTL